MPHVRPKNLRNARKSKGLGKLEIIKKITALTEKYSKPVVALGMFDGVHLGHAAVIRHAVDIAKKIGGTSIVFTFSNHPLSVIAPENAPLMIGNKNH